MNENGTPVTGQMVDDGAATAPRLDGLGASACSPLSGLVESFCPLAIVMPLVDLLTDVRISWSDRRRIGEALRVTMRHRGELLMESRRNREDGMARTSANTEMRDRPDSATPQTHSTTKSE